MTEDEKREKIQSMLSHGGVPHFGKLYLHPNQIKLFGKYLNKDQYEEIKPLPTK